MKLSKKAWLIVGIGIFVIAFGSLYMVYYRQMREQEQLNDSISMAQANLVKVVSEKERWEGTLPQSHSEIDRLEDDLTKATSSLDMAKLGFPESIESIEYGDDLCKIARDCNLEMTNLTSSEPTDEEVETITYSSASFVVDVKGEVDDILDFTDIIRSDYYFDFELPWSASVDLIDINTPEPLTEEEKEQLTGKEIKEREMSLARIHLSVYGL